MADGLKDPVLVVIDRPGPTFELRGCCAYCGATITARSYDVRQTKPEDVDLEAVLDAEAMLAHELVCPKRPERGN